MLYHLLFTSRKPAENHWDVLWYLLRSDSTSKSSQFGILWRALEYSKDEQGVKRLRLLYSPAFRVGGPKPATAKQ